MKAGKAVKWILICVLTVMVGVGAGVMAEGYGMYRRAMEEVSLEDKVASIRGKENYTAFDELPEIYVDPSLEVSTRNL